MDATKAIRQVLAVLGPRAPKRVTRMLTQIERAPQEHRARLCAALACLEPALAPLVTPVGVLCPAYPELGAGPTAAQLAFGARPERVLRGLSAREAHECLSAGQLDPVAWVCRALPEDTVLPRSVVVARWAAECWADPARRAALETPRTIPGPGGVVVEGRFLDRLDEIEEADLANGRGAQAVFRAASARLWARWSETHETDETPLAPEPHWWRPIRCARVLRTRAALIREGREMRHCVGAYADAVARRGSVILSIAVRDGQGNCHRSTAEVRDGVVAQHRGSANAAPPELCVRALDRIMRRRRP